MIIWNWRSYENFIGNLKRILVGDVGERIYKKEHEDSFTIAQDYFGYRIVD